MEKQLTLHEKWELDVKSYDRARKIKTAVPQCESCSFYEKGNALHCKKFVNTRKPRDVMFAHKECEIFVDANPISYIASNVTQNRILGGIFGFCIGDMLGVPVEFSSREERDVDPVSELRAYGTYHQPFGTWSDDSSLMFCLIDAIISGFSAERLKDNMVDYYNKGLFTPNNEVFDIGNSTRAAIDNMINGIPPEKCGGTSESDNGNGSLMRILPLAFICDKKTDTEIVEMVSKVSSFTHRHIRSILACIFYVVFAMKLFDGEEKEDAYDFAVKFIQDNCTDDIKKEFREYRGIFDKSVILLDRNQIHSTGYVIDTLEAVLWVFFNSSSYKEAVLKAVNLGGDTDTIAALVGGLSGIKYGYNDLPQNWLQCIKKKELICDLVKQFEAYISRQ